MSLEDMNR
ncbi:Hypothetical protein SSCIU_02565 [Mammaliicoccus sciuri]|nr:Hypothetical protein SSCIU_02565 [Mammaliicoccus sciuri]